MQIPILGSKDLLRGESEALAEAVPRNAQEEVDARTGFLEVVPRVVCLVSAFLRTVARYRDLWKAAESAGGAATDSTASAP